MVDVLAEVDVKTPGEQVTAAEALKAVIPANHDAAISRESLVRQIHSHYQAHSQSRIQDFPDRGGNPNGGVQSIIWQKLSKTA